MNDSSSDRPIVVGVDGSGTDTAALEWAAASAAVHHSPLLVVYAAEMLSLGAVEDELGTTGRAAYSALREQGTPRTHGSEAAEQIRATHPDLVVEVEETYGPASQALLAHQDRARMIVVGSGRKGTLGQLLLGTTSLTTVMHARCPVAVVNPGAGEESAAPGTIVVAVDGSRDSARAADLAWAEAAARSARVVVVGTWYLEVVDGFVVTEPDSPEWQRIEARQHTRLSEATAAARAAHPDVPHDIDIVHGPSSKVLVERSADADLLVMGNRGRGGFVGKLIGSVTQKVLRGAQCPVLVVRWTEDVRG